MNLRENERTKSPGEEMDRCMSILGWRFSNKN